MIGAYDLWPRRDLYRVKPALTRLRDLGLNGLNFTLHRTVLRIRKFTVLEDTFLFIDLSYTRFVHMPRGMIYAKGFLRKCMFNIMANMDHDMFKVVPIMIVPSTTLYQKRTRWRSRWLINTLMLIKS